MPQRAERDDEDLVRLYLKDIGKHALLTKDDEARLGQSIEEGKFARDRLTSGGAGKERLGKAVASCRTRFVGSNAAARGRSGDIAGIASERYRE